MTDTLDQTNVITEPGVYDAIPDHVYHADPVAAGSLSSSELRRMVIPALYRWGKDNPPAYKREFDFGHAAHMAVLGTGEPVEVLNFDNRRTNAYKAAEEEARTAGRVPVLAADWEIVQSMVDAIRAHPIASALLDPDRGGKPEQSIFWQHHPDVWGRARADWFPTITEQGRPILTDYKTARTADPREFGRHAATFGYHQQAAWYLEGVQSVTGIDNPALVFVVQEKTAPYLVSVVEFDEMALTIGRARNNAAVDAWLRCTESGIWPGYPDEVQLMSLPRWTEIAFEEEKSDEQF